VRAHVGAVLTTDTTDLSADLAEALRGRPSVVVIDGVDRLSSAEHNQLAARLRDARTSTALLLTSLSPELAERLLADAGRTPVAVIDIDAPRRPSSALPVADDSSESTEVTA